MTDRIDYLASGVLHNLERVEEITRMIRRISYDHEAAADLAENNLHRAMIDLAKAVGELMGAFAQHEPDGGLDHVQPRGVAA